MELSDLNLTSKYAIKHRQKVYNSEAVREQSHQTNIQASKQASNRMEARINFACMYMKERKKLIDINPQAHTSKRKKEKKNNM